MRNSKFGLTILLAIGFLLWVGLVPVQAAALSVSITKPASGARVPSPVQYVGKVQGGIPPYTYRWTFSGGTPTSLTIKTNKLQSAVKVTYSPGTYQAVLRVIDGAGTSATARDQVEVIVPKKSINSTSDNRTKLPATLVAERKFTTRNGFQLLAANDLGMHCGDLDHRIASILPPFNVVHAQAIKRGARPQILTGQNATVFYSATSNPQDPALARATHAPIFKTNFWDFNPRTGNTLVFDGYDPFYPKTILPKFTLNVDWGLPVPDLERFYLGDKNLVLDQQVMPGQLNPYVANASQLFGRFYTDLPFFINFPFGYTISDIKWFSAEGIPIAPFDDLGRKNSYPLMRIQSKDKTGALTGTANTVLASVDTVLPVSAEAECWRCHTSSQDGGTGQAACISGIDANCPQGFQGSPRLSGTPPARTPFTVATASLDTAPLVPFEASREWAADNNILRLHDAKHPTVTPKLENSTPVVCQRCHYTPALDLAHLGPLGPGDGDLANGRDQRIHHTNSRTLHTFHGQLASEGLFPNDMPPPTDRRRHDATGKLVINAFVNNVLNDTCYQCHPGKVTKCLRGAMFNGGLVCQDCHGGMLQVGNDFSQNLSAGTPFPAGADLTKRVPWANEPGCQSCHTGDALDNLGLTDPNVIRSPDGIRLLQAYRTIDKTTAKPIVATNRRFAENQTAGGTQILYRVSKEESHGGLFCEGCHGSTHAEWPVQPEGGIFVANDNTAAIELQGHTGKIIECGACHAPAGPTITQALALSGPHGLHAVGDQRWINAHPNLIESGLPENECRKCHGARGLGTVLGKVAANRTFAVEGRGQVTLTQGSLVRCNFCHDNPL